METDPSKSGSSMVPVAIGLAGVAIGAIAFFVAISKGSSAATDIAALKQALADNSSNATLALQTAQNVDTKLTPLAQGFDVLKRSQVDVINSVNQSTAELKTLTEKVDKIGTRPVVASSGGGASAEHASTVVPGQGGDYKVESLDNPTSIGKKFGVSAQAILDANPGLNAKNMHVGDMIHIPAASAPRPPASTGARSAPPTPASSATTAP